MSRKRGECTRKKKHPTLLSAQIACARTKNAQMQVYKCPHCHKYHIGRSDKPWKKEQRLDQLFRRIKIEDKKRKELSLK